MTTASTERGRLRKRRRVQHRTVHAAPIPVSLSSHAPQATQTGGSAGARHPDRARFGRGQLRAVGRALQDIRRANGWSLKRLAAASRISVGAIQRIEAGEASASLLTVAVLAEALGTSMDRLVRASRSAIESTHFVHTTIPERLKNAIDVTGGLRAPRMKVHVVALTPQSSRHIDTSRSGGALFAYVIRGRLRLTAADGAVDELNAGDVVHWSIPGRMTWFNPRQRPMLALCVIDQRHDRAIVLPGGL